MDHSPGPILHLITSHMIVFMPLTNPRPPRAVHILPYCPPEWLNAMQYCPEFDLYTRSCTYTILFYVHVRAASLAVTCIRCVIHCDLGKTVLDALPHGCATQACVGRYCSRRSLQRSKNGHECARIGPFMAQA